ncbi:hypothetical protein D3C76_1455720 [compost metagenome]
MGGHAGGAEGQHQQAMAQARQLPEERHQGAHRQGVAQSGEEVAGGGAVVRRQLAGEQLIEAEAQRRAERKQDGRGEQRATGMDDDQHTDEPQDHCGPLAKADLFLQQGR